MNWSHNITSTIMWKFFVLVSVQYFSAIHDTQRDIWHHKITTKKNKTF